MTAQPSSSVDGPALPGPMAQHPALVNHAPVHATLVAARPPRRGRIEPFIGVAPRGPLLLGLTASLLMVLGGFGAGGILVRDPLLSDSSLGFWRYGHGRELATAMVYVGVVLLAVAWVRLGREVLARRVGGRGVLVCAAAWSVPMLFSAPLFTRDVFSYLAQGALPLAGFDPYAVGPEVLPGIFTDNVHHFWQDTPAPYGPLFILLAKGIAALVGDNVILGVVLMRLALLPGLALLVWALPELTRRLGGRVSVALWIALANPVTIIHLVGGGHNDMLVVGFLAAGSLLALRGRHAGGIALVTAAMAVKASAGVALPFIVLVWAAHLPGSRRSRLVKATASGIAVFAVVFGAITVVAGVGLGWLPALSAPSLIVNWMSVPTGVGELVHGLVGLVVDLPKQPFINLARLMGGIALLVIGVRQWWAACDGGPEAVHRAGIVLLACALLSPVTLPWYVSWGMVLLAMVAWSPRRLAWVVFGSLGLVAVYYPDGEAALYNWPYLAGAALLCALAAVSLLRADPLRLRADERSRAMAAVPAVEVVSLPVEPVVTSGAEQRAG